MSSRNDRTSAVKLSSKQVRTWRAALIHENRQWSALTVDADEMIATPLKPTPCDRQVLDAILGAIKQHRRAVATLKTRKLEQCRLAWRLWSIEYDETIPIVAPEEPEWAIMAADIKAAEQEKRELTAVVERVGALLTYSTHLVDGKVTTGITDAAEPTGA
jgi:hypothetical protein